MRRGSVHSRPHRRSRCAHRWVGPRDVDAGVVALSHDGLEHAPQLVWQLTCSTGMDGTMGACAWRHAVSARASRFRHAEDLRIAAIEALGELGEALDRGISISARDPSPDTDQQTPCAQTILSVDMLCRHRGHKESAGDGTQSAQAGNP